MNPSGKDKRMFWVVTAFTWKDRFFAAWSMLRKGNFVIGDVHLTPRPHYKDTRSEVFW